MPKNRTETALKRFKIIFYKVDDETKEVTNIVNDEVCIDNYILVAAYIRKRKNEGLAHSSITNDVKGLTSFFKLVKSPLMSVTELELYEYFDQLDSKSKRTAQAYKLILKSFFIFAKREDLSAMCKFKISKSERKLPEDLLTEDEIGKMINTALNLKDRALIAILYETGARIGELEELQIKHITFDENGAVLILPKGKTGARRNRIVFAAGYIRHWLEVHPDKDNPEAWIWASSRNKDTRITYETISIMLKTCARRAGINKRVHPHLFRHTRATELAQHLTEQQMKALLGWTQNSPMASIYVHLSGKDIDEAILKMNGIDIPEEKKESQLKIIRCPRCKEIQGKTNKFCFKCGLPLSENTVSEIQKVKNAAVDWIRENPEEFLKMLQERK